MNATNIVLMSEKTVTAATWAGTSFGNNLKSAIPFSAGNTIIKAVVYSPDAGIQVRLKAEDKNDPTLTVETDTVTTVANGWDTLYFDFSMPSAGTNPMNFATNLVLTVQQQVVKHIMLIT
jgi:hypothetical protein